MGLAATACSDSDSDNPGPTPSSDTGVTTSDDTGVANSDAGVGMDAAETLDGGADCPRSDPVNATPDPGCNAAYTAIVRGQAVNQAGTPITGVLAQMCIDVGTGMPLCLRPEPTCGPGYFELPIGENDRCISSAVVHMIPTDSTYASSFCLLDFENPAPVDFTVSTPFVSFELQAPTTLPPEGVTTQERTVVFAGGIELDVVPERIVAFDGYTSLASRVLSASDPLPCEAADENFDGIVAFGPAANIQTPQIPASQGFPIRIPAGDLAEGTMVDLFVQGSLDCALEDGSTVKEAEWERFATATVDANGMISGARLPCFNWLAWRAVP